MKLSDLIDLETRLALDAQRDPAELRARDRAIGAGLEDCGADITRLLGAWLVELRRRKPDQLAPGRTAQRALSWMRLGLATLGLLGGWGLAEAVLYFDGSQPVNLLNYLGLFVGLQLLLLLLVGVGLLAPHGAGQLPVVRELRDLLRWIASATVVRLGVPADRAEAWRSALRRMAGRRSLYTRVEPWLMLGLTQVLGVAFNIGALLCCLRLVTFSDLAFAWGSTVRSLDVATLHGLVEALATPWAWALPDAVPSLELVRETNYSRLQAGYVASAGRSAVDPLLVGGWWSFLLVATAVYGLLPRALALVLAWARTSWLLGHLPLDDMELRRVVDRLTQPRVELQAAEPEAGDTLAPPGDPPRGFERGDAGQRCELLLWRDTPHDPGIDTMITAALGWQVGETRQAGGGGLDDERAVHAALADAADESAPIVVLVEAWEAPDKTTLRFIKGVREAVGARRPIAVGLLQQDPAQAPRAPAADDVQTWRTRLASLQDPYLGVEPLEPGS